MALRPQPSNALPTSGVVFKRVGASGALCILLAAGGVNFVRRLATFVGPGFVVAVGYMDPGNWATDLAAGSATGYLLLSVVVVAGAAAIVLQILAAKLGIATSRDLAQSCRDNFSGTVNLSLWLLAEVGICACDLAELIGTAFGLKLAFGLPLMPGLILTVADVMVILLLQQRGFRKLEATMAGLLALVAGCFIVQLAMLRPDWGQVTQGLVPSPAIVATPATLYLAIGIVGATIMPHNLYLHSSIAQLRRRGQDRKEAVLLSSFDCIAALMLATLVNAAILILAAAAFHAHGGSAVTDILEAHRLLVPLLGTAASALFALALIASGQSSSVAATLAGQVVMEGFVSIRLKPWQRRLMTRLVAAAPAILVVWFFGEASIGKLLILSQVILSLQLPFAIVPLLMFTGNRAKMGELVNSRGMSILAWAISAAIVTGNVVLIAQAAA